MHRKPLHIAVLGAEATGKTRTIEFLAKQMAAISVQAVIKPELLRIWCDQHQRTPGEDEQEQLLQAGIHQLTELAPSANLRTVVLHDTTPLQTAAYHWHYFGSDALDDAAVQSHRYVDFTLLMAPDLPLPKAHDWQRDGAEHQMPVHQRLLYLLEKTGQPWVLVEGAGDVRLRHAWQVVVQSISALAADGWGSGVL